MNRSDGGFLSYRTNVYKLHYYETATNLKFVLLTDPALDSVTAREILKQIHGGLYVEYVVKNPLAKSEGIIDNELFKSGVQRFIRGLPGFKE